MSHNIPVTYLYLAELPLELQFVGGWKMDTKLIIFDDEPDENGVGSGRFSISRKIDDVEQTETVYFSIDVDTDGAYFYWAAVKLQDDNTFALKSVREAMKSAGWTIDNGTEYPPRLSDKAWVYIIESDSLKSAVLQVVNEKVRVSRLISSLTKAVNSVADKINHKK